MHPFLPLSGPWPALPVQGGLPSDWGEERVKALLAPYGLLRSFNLMLDRGTGRSKVRCVGGGERGQGICSTCGRGTYAVGHLLLTSSVNTTDGTGARCVCR